MATCTFISYSSGVPFRFLHPRIDNPVMPVLYRAYVEVSKLILMEECNILILLTSVLPNTEVRIVSESILGKLQQTFGDNLNLCNTRP